MKANLWKTTPLKKTEIIKVKDNHSFSYTDDIAVEEPLEIRVSYGPKQQNRVKISPVTMRTPDKMKNLLQALFTEGIISGDQQISTVAHHQAECSRNQGEHHHCRADR